ncbi:NAD-dependent epimerase/dehydratase family protein [Ornithinibacillus halophilus]|uniref:Nucleoside-diphosphate-sugar epimerase n=1 Tax=Ornithinibacillus halophilus TaxID=930117 RepID=A0A1M5LMA2_9BACI|nr:NAD-dependent epimerase/dehydratase family protein [Ornithinibacillus halophilus]SHG65463.1 Nucleoside-diphosphate-sugar epimerase [Ornithinibacillus halophilus]
MKTALVLGGTRFFGVNLVETLLEKGVQVTIATRQNSTDPFGDKVDRLKLDRFSLESFKEAVEGRSWDVVFDQLCFSSNDAEIAVKALSGKIGRYVFTSTLSVYDAGENMKEELFDPKTYELKMVDKENVTYKEGKRQAEAYFYQKASFPVVAVRIPIVLGEEDYTERLLHYVKNIQEEKPVYFPNPSAEMCFIHQIEAGQFIAGVGSSDYSGPINACANGVITMNELMQVIGNEVGKEPVITTVDQQDSPYAIPETWYLSNEKATELGYSFTNLSEWLPGLINHLNNKRSL